MITAPGPPRPAPPASSASSGRRSAGAEVGRRWEGASGSAAAGSAGDGSAAPETRNKLAHLFGANVLFKALRDIYWFSISASCCAGYLPGISHQTLIKHPLQPEVSVCT